MKKYRYLLTDNLQSSFYYLIRAYCWTFRLQIENEKPWLEHLQKGGRILLCCWHQQFFSAIRHFKTYAVYHPGLMISQSRDGDVIAGIAEKTGWHIVRGSSSRNGNNALKEMILYMGQSGFAGHVVDGPRGPAGIVKAGVIRLAQGTGAFIVPFYISADRCWYFNSWDRFMLPKPFARVTLRFGEMLDLTSGTGEEDFEHNRLQLQAIMQPGLHHFGSQQALDNER
ncbi:MAG: lysophospholipid acyltransferase family protein [Deltaproteobacteria bacterium]|nr:lysophospholipid acyltransferase family protein [Deltaproteobacteria bacterium]